MRWNNQVLKLQFPQHVWAEEDRQITELNKKYDALLTPIDVDIESMRSAPNSPSFDSLIIRLHERNRLRQQKTDEEQKIRAHFKERCSEELEAIKSKRSELMSKAKAQSDRAMEFTRPLRELREFMRLFYIVEVFPPLAMWESGQSELMLCESCRS